MVDHSLAYRYERIFRSDCNQRKHKPILKRNKTSLHLLSQFVELSICDAKTFPFTFLKLLHCSLRDKYNGIFSVKLGSFKAVMASSSEAVKEVLVKKSADYAGRPQMHVFYVSTLGMFNVKCTDATTPNIVEAAMLDVVASVLAVVWKRMQQLPKMLDQ